MFSTIIAAVREHEADDVLGLVLLLVGVLCLIGSAWRAYCRDFPVAVALLLIGLVILFIAT